MMKSILIGALFALLASPGCASMKERAHQQAEARDHVYPRPLSQLWPEVRELLSSEGYRVPDQPDRKANSLTTGWKTIGNQNYRYIAKGTEISPNESRILIIQEVSRPRTLVDTEETRDSMMEWKLLKKVEPETAKRIESGEKGSAG